MEHDGNIMVSFVFTDPIYRVSEAGFEIFSRFSNLDNLTLEISAFHPAFDLTLETLIHLTSITAILAISKPVVKR